MYCANCGSPVKEDSSFCTACGNKIEPLDQSGQIRRPQEVQKKPMPLWFKLLIGISVIALIAVAGGIWLTENIRATVEDQLQALKDHDISKAYYGYTSKEFQESTPLETFRAFVNSYPILSHTKSANFNERTIEKNVGILKGTLTADDGATTPIEYELVKSDGKWKILSIHVPTLAPQTLIVAAETSALLNSVIEQQLKLLRSHEIEKAYSETTSTEFRTLTKLSDFKNFIDTYPLLSEETKVEYGTPTMLDKVAALAITLKKDHHEIIMEYNLIREDGKWKIWGMRGQSPNEASDLSK